MSKELGRPKIEIDYDQLKKLAELQCTAKEICHFFSISEDTLSRRVKEHFDVTFAEYIKKHAMSSKISLRRAQLDKAMSGNVPMLIWLGKQYLGQCERKVDDAPQETVVRLAYRVKSDRESDESSLDVQR